MSANLFLKQTKMSLKECQSVRKWRRFLDFPVDDLGREELLSADETEAVLAIVNGPFLESFV